MGHSLGEHDTNDENAAYIDLLFRVLRLFPAFQALFFSQTQLMWESMPNLFTIFLSLVYGKLSWSILRDTLVQIRHCIIMSETEDVSVGLFLTGKCLENF